MSKLSFRARALDATKPLPIYHADDLPDLSDFSTINRTVPQMPTGMEKEEESERHLQDVIQAKQANSVKKKHVYIPTPEAAIPVKHYDQIAAKVIRAHQYIRVPGLGVEEVPDYDLDSEDEEWLNAQSNERPLSPTHFELMMDKLEKGSGNTVLSEREAQGLLRDDENLVLAVYDYWLAKRLRLGCPLIPVVKQEGRDVGSGSNPYLAFRKRTEKMQTRKNRKNDEMAYMQMLKLKRDLEKAVSLFEWVKEREQKKEDLARVQMDIFKKRYQLEDWSGNIVSSLQQASNKKHRNSALGDWTKLKLDAEYDVHHVGRQDSVSHSGPKRKKKTRKYDMFPETPLTPSTPEKAHRDSAHDLSTDRLDDEEYDGLFSFKRKPHVRYHSCREPLGVWPWSNDDHVSPAHKDHPDDGDVMIMDYAPYAVSHAASRERARSSGSRRKYRFSRASLSNGGIGLSRRRVGRGGRVLWDRLTLRELQNKTNLSPLADRVPMKEAPPTGRAEDTRDGTEGGGGGTTDMSVDGDGDSYSSSHFQPHSPPSSSSSSFEFTHLPLIEQPGSNDTLSSRASANSSTPFSGFSLAFRGLPLSSEYREDAKTFSALPTSQFFLQSLSPHVEIDYQSSLLSSDSSWGLVPGVKGQSGQTRTLSENALNSSSLHSPSAPSSNYPNGGSSTSDSSTDRTRQVSLVESEQTVGKELSRSSLSVADSKTIVLSNVSLPRPKHQLEKTQRLPSTSSDGLQKDALKTPVNGPAKTESLKDAPPTEQAVGSKLLSESPQKKPETSKEIGQPSKSDQTASLKEATETKSSVLSKPTSTSSTSTTSVTPTTVDKKERNVSTATLSLSTPADYIQGFDVAPTKNRTKSTLRKKSRALLSSLTTANVITSQLGLYQATKKKDPVLDTSQVSINGQPSTPTALSAIVSSITTSAANPVPTLSAAKLAELQSSLLNSHDKTSVASVSDLASGLSGLVDRKTTASTTAMASIANAVTANSHVGQALSSVTSAVARRASTGTNGTNYQEIFTATRRISETAERGLKQALAGMNHTSLLETANSLVQLSNSSEVT